MNDFSTLLKKDFWFYLHFSLRYLNLNFVYHFFSKFEKCHDQIATFRPPYFSIPIQVTCMKNYYIISYHCIHWESESGYFSPSLSNYSYCLIWCLIHNSFKPRLHYFSWKSVSKVIIISVKQNIWYLHPSIFTKNHFKIRLCSTYLSVFTLSFNFFSSNLLCSSCVTTLPTTCQPVFCFSPFDLNFFFTEPVVLSCLAYLAKANRFLLW